MTRELPEHDLLGVIMRTTSPAVNILQKLLGLGYDLDRPAKDRAALWRELAGHLGELAEFAEQCEARAVALDYLDGGTVVDEPRALPPGTT